MKGHVVLRDGSATLSRVIFSVPGATAHGGGTYDVISKKVNLTGQVADGRHGVRGVERP